TRCCCTRAPSSPPTRLPGRPGRPSAPSAPGSIAGACVCAPTSKRWSFPMSLQAYVLGSGIAAVGATLQTSSGLVLVSLLPHALPGLVALFLPLAAWTVARRRGAWDELL